MLDAISIPISVCFVPAAADRRTPPLVFLPVNDFIIEILESHLDHEQPPMHEHFSLVVLC